MGKFHIPQTKLALIKWLVMYRNMSVTTLRQMKKNQLYAIYYKQMNNHFNRG